MNAVARFRHLPFGTGATLWYCDCPRRVDPVKGRQLSLDVSGPTPLATPDDHQHSSAIARTVTLIDWRAGRRDACPHAEQAWIRVHLEAPTLCSGLRNFWAHERGSLNSTRVERWGEIFGLEGLDEREDSMRSRASLPFGQLSSFGRGPTLASATGTRSTGPNLVACDVVVRWPEFSRPTSREIPTR